MGLNEFGEVLDMSSKDRHFATIKFVAKGKPHNEKRYYLLRVFDNEHRKQICSRGFPEDSLQHLNLHAKFSPDGRFFVINHTDNTIDFLKVDTLETVATVLPNLTAEENGARLVSWSISPDGNLLAIAYYRFRPALSRVEVRNIGTEHVIHTFNEDENVKNLSFSPDGNYLAIAYSTNLVLVRDIRSRKEVYRFSHDLGREEIGRMFAKFSRDNKLLLTGVDRVYDGIDRLWVWDLSNGQKVTEIVDPKNGARFPADISPDGRLIVASVEMRRGIALLPDMEGVPVLERKFKIWDLKTGKCVYESPLSMDQHPQFLRFSRDGKYLFRAKGAFEVYEIIEK